MNATTEVAERQLAALVPALRAAITVHGDARKFLVDPGVTQVPERVDVEGLQRGVLLRRRAYLGALRDAWSRAGCGASETMVCGDIYEMDLALPAALGAQVHLVLRPTTHAYERSAVAALGARGGVSNSLHGLLERVG